MPDFNHLADQLLTDMSGADWLEADVIRSAGNRRGRVQLLMTVSMAAAVVVTAVAVVLANPTLLPSNNASVAPAASQGRTLSPSVTPSTASTSGPSTGPTQQRTIPPDALLTTAKVGPAFSGLEPPFAQPYTPNPFIGCGPDGLPGAQQFTEVIGTALTGGTSALLGGESLMRFQPGAAHQVMTAISQLAAGGCAGPFQILRRDLGGDESILITSSDPNVVLAQAAHGKAIYYAIERRGDYLVWMTLVDQAQKTGQASLAVTLISRAAQQLCTTITC